MKNTRRFISAVMALAMVSAIAPMGAFAADGDPTTVNQDSTTKAGTMTATYNVQAAYTVTIPAGVTLSNSEAVPKNIEASGVILESGKKITVKLTGASNTESGASFSAKTTKGDSTATYTIGKGEATTGISVGDTVAEFTGNGTQTLSFSTVSGATYAGEHTETLTFTIGVENAKTNVSSVTITDTSTTALTKGGTLNLTATVDESATDKTITWSSSDDTVASVDGTGKVTANKSGTATITVTATNGTEDTADDKTDSITITVTNPVTNITIPATLGLATGTSGNLTATVTPSDADDTTVTWTSSDGTVATVDNTGKVTAIASGTTTITATIGDKTATCQVTVATLADAFKKDAIVKINYVYSNGDNSCTFKSNGDGTYTFISGTGFEGNDTDCAKELKADNNNLIFKQNFYETIDKFWKDDGFSITFDKSNNTYSEWKGSEVRPYNWEAEDDVAIGDASFKAIEVNGVNITSTLSKQ